MRKILSKLILLGCLLATALFVHPRIIHAEEDNTSIKPSYDAIIIDDADLLTASEEEKLLEEMKPILEYGNILLYTVTNNPYSAFTDGEKTEKLAKEYYESNYSGKDGAVFVIDMMNRQLAIYCAEGIFKSCMGNSIIDTIMDNVYTYASNNNYYSCAKETFSQMYKRLKGQDIPQPMKYIGNALIAIGIGCIVAFSILRGTAKVKTATHQEKLSAIFAKTEIMNPHAEFSHQTRVYDPPKSSGSHSSGGGGGGGGGGSSGSHGF